MFNNPMAFVVQGMLKELAEEGEISEPRWVSRVLQAPGWVVRKIMAVRQPSEARNSDPCPDMELTRAAQ